MLFFLLQLIRPVFVLADEMANTLLKLEESKVSENGTNEPKSNHSPTSSSSDDSGFLSTHDTSLLAAKNRPTNGNSPPMQRKSSVKDRVKLFSGQKPAGKTVSDKPLKRFESSEVRRSACDNDGGVSGGIEPPPPTPPLPPIDYELSSYSPPTKHITVLSVNEEPSSKANSKRSNATETGKSPATLPVSTGGVNLLSRIANDIRPIGRPLDEDDEDMKVIRRLTGASSDSAFSNNSPTDEQPKKIGFLARAAAEIANHQPSASSPTDHKVDEPKEEPTCSVFEDPELVSLYHCQRYSTPHLSLLDFIFLLHLRLWYILCVSV